MGKVALTMHLITTSNYNIININKFLKNSLPYIKTTYLTNA